MILKKLSRDNAKFPKSRRFLALRKFMKYNHPMNYAQKISARLTLLVLLGGACAEFLDIAWGAGDWLGEMSAAWAGISLTFLLLCLLFLFTAHRLLGDEALAAQTASRLIAIRRQLGWGRWALAAVMFILPAALLQFTILGILFHGFFLRVGLWGLSLLAASFLLASEDALFLNWERFLFLALLSSAMLVVLASLKAVTDYPFSLGWSEGNRLWDYSILFGSGRYQVAAGQEIPVFLDLGRQFIGGIPFLLTGLTIQHERLWLGVVSIAPYLLLGLAVFRSTFREKHIGLAAILWTFIFLRQGPVGTPLLLSATLSALAWRSELWIALPLVIFATDAAYTSRFTWVFAPGIWFFMLELFDGLRESEGGLRLTERARFLSLILVFGGITAFLVFGLALGAYLGLEWTRNLPGIFFDMTSAFGRISAQPLLWYRLLPNETYPSGILIGTATAVLPLAALACQSKINRWQKWILALPLLAFFVVGLVVSAKIGGGGDLHNMDMFLVGVLLAAAVIARQQGGWIQNPHSAPLWVRAAFIALVMIPGISPLRELRSYEFGAQAARLAALTDAPNERALEMYPPDAVVKKSLAVIQSEADAASISGEVLFIDQRQLLTFGYIQNVPLIPQYEKKVLMDQALAADELYFQAFYRDLADRRFSLIVVQPLIEKSQGMDEFGEENNAWVKWATKPLLCFYEVKQTLAEVNVQLLIPKLQDDNCKFMRAE